MGEVNRGHYTIVPIEEKEGVTCPEAYNGGPGVCVPPLKVFTGVIIEFAEKLEGGSYHTRIGRVMGRARHHSAPDEVRLVVLALDRDFSFLMERHILPNDVLYAMHPGGLARWLLLTEESRMPPLVEVFNELGRGAMSNTYFDRMAAMHGWDLV